MLHIKLDRIFLSPLKFKNVAAHLFNATFFAAGAVAIFPSAYGDVCADRTAIELQKSTFSVCKSCHTNPNVAPPWLLGSSPEVFGNVTALLKKPIAPYTSSDQNILIAKPFEPALAHGGGKGFSATTRAEIVQYLSDLDVAGCLEGIKLQPPPPVSTPPPVTRQLQLTPPTYSQVEHFLQTLTGNPSGKTMKYLSLYKTQLGFADSRTQTDSKMPVSPVSMAVLNKLLSWGCAEASDRRDWALIPRTEFESTLTDFVIEMLGIPLLQAQILAKNILSLEDARTSIGKSIRASRVSACYITLKSERLWLR